MTTQYGNGGGGAGAVIGSTDLVRVTQSTPQSVADLTVLTWDTETYKTVVAMHSNTVNPSRLICVTAGIYAFSSQLGTAAGPTDLGGIIRLNGVTQIAHTALAANGPNTDVAQAVGRYRLAINDYVEIIAHINSTARNTVIADCWFSMELLSNLP